MKKNRRSALGLAMEQMQRQSRRQSKAQREQYWPDRDSLLLTRKMIRLAFTRVDPFLGATTSEAQLLREMQWRNLWPNDKSLRYGMMLPE